MIGKHLHILCTCTMFDASARAEIRSGARREISIRQGLTDTRGMIACVALLLFDNAAADYQLARNVLLRTTLMVVSFFYCQLRATLVSLADRDDAEPFFSGGREMEEAFVI